MSRNFYCLDSKILNFLKEWFYNNWNSLLLNLDCIHHLNLHQFVKQSHLKELLSIRHHFPHLTHFRNQPHRIFTRDFYLVFIKLKYFGIHWYLHLRNPFILKPSITFLQELYYLQDSPNYLNLLLAKAF